MKLVARVAKREVPEGELVRVEYPPYDVLVVRRGGAFFAIEDACNHAGASLAEGGLVGDCVSCPMHGYLFDLGSGALVSPKGLCDDQRSFVVEDEGDVLAIWDPFELVVLGPVG